jgi:hypothetical protein
VANNILVEKTNIAGETHRKGRMPGPRPTFATVDVQETLRPLAPFKFLQVEKTDFGRDPARSLGKMLLRDIVCEIEELSALHLSLEAACSVRTWHNTRKKNKL